VNLLFFGWYCPFNGVMSCSIDAQIEKAFFPFTKRKSGVERMEIKVGLRLRRFLKRIFTRKVDKNIWGFFRGASKQENYPFSGLTREFIQGDRGLFFKKRIFHADFKRCNFPAQS